jgi:hypothetical protein
VEIATDQALVLGSMLMALFMDRATVLEMARATVQGMALEMEPMDRVAAMDQAKAEAD